MPRAPRKQIEDGKTVQYTTLKVRLYPDEAQAELFENTFGCCRWIWNHMLADQQRFYLETDQHFIPTPAKYKSEAPFLKEVDNQALIQEHNKLSQAFRVFFKDPKTFGAPKFKKKKTDKDSFTACNHVFESGPTIYIIRDGIRMTKAGTVKAKFSRRPRNGWKLKRVTVEKTKTGKYFAYILYEYIVKEPEAVTPTPDTTVGLKYSMGHFYVADSGELADPPHWLKQSREKLAGLQQKLARMEPGSRNYQEAVRKYRLLHEHIANQRRDFIHKESSRISDGELEELVKRLKGWGLDAIEGYYPKHSPEQQAFYLHLAEKYQLHQTGGSDFHGEKVKPDVELAALELELGWLHSGSKDHKE